MKVILKVTAFNINYETRNILRQSVIKQLNEDGVAIVPSWCDVIVLDDSVEVSIEKDKDSTRKG